MVSAPATATPEPEPDFHAGRDDVVQVETLSEKARLARHTVYSAAAHGANLLPFILWFIAAERLGPEKFGVFSYALAFASVFEILADLGLRDYVVREIARDRGALVLASRILSWRLLLVLVTMVAAVLVFEITRPTAEARQLLWIMAPMVALRSLKHYLRGVLQAIGRFGVDTVITVADRVLMVIAGLAALLGSGTVLALAAALLAARLIDILVSSITLYRVTGLSPRGGFGTVWSAQREALPLGLFLIITSAYTYADQIMIALMRGDAEVGLYTACYKIHEGFTMIPAILSAPVLPALAASVEARPQRAAELARRAVKYAVAAAVGLALVLGLPARELLVLVYGDAYRSAAPAMIGLLAATTFTFSLWLLYQVLIATARRAAMVKLVAFGLGLNLALNAVMIPRIGFVGAAWATLIGEGISVWVTAWTASRALPGMRVHRAFVGPLVCGAGALAVGLWLRHLGVPAAAQSAAAGASLIALLFVTRTFDRSDREAMLSVVRPARRAPAPGGD
jgi:O-antigen/teichoic acid export membrane protein